MRNTQSQSPAHSPILNQNKQKTMQRFLLLFFTVIVSLNVFSQDSKRLSLLSNRYSCDFPLNATYLDNSSIQSVKEGYSESITDIIYFLHKDKILFHVKELHEKESESMEQSLKEQYKKSKVVSLGTINSLHCFSITPNKIDKKKPLLILRQYIIIHSDNSISKIDIRISPDAYARKETILTSSDKIIQSIQKEEKQYTLKAYTAKHNVLKTGTVLEIPLPKDYILITDIKPENEYYSVVKIVPYGSETKTELVIHFDKNLELIRTTFNLIPHRTPDTHAEFMLHQALWYNFYDRSRNLYLRENAFNDADISKDCFFSMSMLSNSQDGIDELTDIVKKILFIYAK